jgi:imidazoleglycerol phosphate synthase glutamine amidotransferase subunit HisH
MGGNVERITAAPRLPHIGWNQVESRRPHALTDAFEIARRFYFVHSFAPCPPTRA